MKSHSQKMRIAEKLIHITNDLRNRYIGEYGTVPTWEGVTQDIFLLNCDMEIQNFLKKEEVEIHEDVYTVGISFGVFILQKEIAYIFTKKYGEEMNYNQKNEMYETMQCHIFDYIVNGVFNAY
jgi:hypothetical protein